MKQPEILSAWRSLKLCNFCNNHDLQYVKQPGDHTKSTLSSSFMVITNAILLAKLLEFCVGTDYEHIFKSCSHVVSSTPRWLCQSLQYADIFLPDYTASLPRRE